MKLEKYDPQYLYDLFIMVDTPLFQAGLKGSNMERWYKRFLTELEKEVGVR